LIVAKSTYKHTRNHKQSIYEPRSHKSHKKQCYHLSLTNSNPQAKLEADRMLQEAMKQAELDAQEQVAN
jgi:hypothetical protein